MENLLPNMQNDEEAAPLRPREAAEEDHEEAHEMEERIDNVQNKDYRPVRIALKLGVTLTCAVVLPLAGWFAYNVATSNSTTPYNITR